MEFIGPTSQSLISQRTRLHYADWGNAGAPPLILLHGGRDHARSWDWTAQQLRHDWHVICPDLRGHGDSEWNRPGDYPITGYVYDLAQLVHQLGLAPVTIAAHSLGGNIALRYTGLYPDKVRRLVAIEGLGPSPEMQKKQLKTPFDERVCGWIHDKRAAAARLPKRYDSFDMAFDRMMEANGYLSPQQGRHLTLHAVMRNEDGSYSWKFDPYVHLWPPIDLPYEDIEALWRHIACPTLLIYGEDSWASNPAEDGRIAHFANATVSNYAEAGHWVHHDQFDRFIAELREFL
ncbi:alpha/beta fold hydrolase [Novosphingopyxis sp.]|uniref:alpha/beta fold hydrolase n=1 Tax=Novosphingopyxis sp. TaxID=2709690 RepID=UPI003B5B1518